MASSTLHLVDPELKPLVEREMQLELNAQTLEATRTLLKDMLAQAGPSPAHVHEYHAKSGDGAPDVPIVVHSPPDGSTGSGLRPAVLNIHGGGMVLGDAWMLQGADGKRALTWDCVIASVDYRLAPETPFPGPIEDCYAALRWLFENAHELGVDPARIAIMGDSAGGGLAASLALLARDRGAFRPCAQLLNYPMLDHRSGGEDDQYNNPITGEFIWPRASNQFGWESLRGDYALDDDRVGHFSASLADDLSALPPAVILTSALDLFLDENLDYARRLSAAGVPVELHCYAGAPHGFPMMRDARISRQFEADLKNAALRLLA